METATYRDGFPSDGHSVKETLRPTIRAHATTSTEDKMIATVTTKKTTDAHFAHCPECDTWLGSPYWNLSKSVAMHKRGTGHAVTLLKIADAA